MPFFDCITDFIFIEDQPQKADVILIPGGRYAAILDRAVQLYKAGYAPLVLPSGKFSVLETKFLGPLDKESGNRTWPTEWAYMQEELVRQGIPTESVLREDQAGYTYQNALYSRNVTDQAGLKVSTALICCQAYHARRCLMYYQIAFPDTRLLICPAVTQDTNREHWFEKEKSTELVLGEMERCGNQFHQIMKEWREETHDSMLYF